MVDMKLRQMVGDFITSNPDKIAKMRWSDLSKLVNVWFGLDLDDNFIDRDLIKMMGLTFRDDSLEDSSEVILW